MQRALGNSTLLHSPSLFSVYGQHNKVSAASTVMHVTPLLRAYRPCPVALESINNLPNQYEWQSVITSGTFDVSEQILLRNRY